MLDGDGEKLFVVPGGERRLSIRLFAFLKGSPHNVKPLEKTGTANDSQANLPLIR